MTTQPTLAAELPQALRLADELRKMDEAKKYHPSGPGGQMLGCEQYRLVASGFTFEHLQAAAEELRRLHAYCQELESQVILDCMTHVQNPAEIEHVVGDVSKNGAEVNTNVYAELPPRYYLAGGVEKTWDQQQMCVFADATHALRAQQPAPATQKLTEQICISDTNQSAACAVGSVGTTSDAQTTRSTHDAPATQQAGEVSDAMVLAALQVQYPATYGQYLRHPASGPKTSIRTEAEIDTARRMIAAALAATPQPSPTPQAAESVPAIQGETNVQLDIDSNHSAPGQQRDVARSVALGQPIGNGQDQAAGHLGAQGDKLLTVAERNIRSFLRSAVFKSESDREAALSCVDVLRDAASAAQADSVLEDADASDLLDAKH